MKNEKKGGGSTELGLSDRQQFDGKKEGAKSGVTGIPVAPPKQKEGKTTIR